MTNRLRWLRRFRAMGGAIVLLFAAADATMDSDRRMLAQAVEPGIQPSLPAKSLVSDSVPIVASSAIAALLVAFGIEWIVHRRQVRRMQRLLDQAGNVIDEEVVSCTRELTESHETLMEELNALRTTESRLRSAQAILEETSQRSAWLSDVDPITSLPNRRRFDEILACEWRRASGQLQSISLLWVDVDCFKQFSETYGQSVADDCLRAIAEVLGGAVARRAGSLIARIGGEEFAVLLCNTDSDGAMNVARLILATTEQMAIEHETTRVIGTSIVTVSIGVAAVRPDPTNCPSLLLFRADEALYRAQVEGRACVRGYEESTGTRLRPLAQNGGPAAKSSLEGRNPSGVMGPSNEAGFRR
jgi:diguanylate cyclase (GGDEF)-like protein